VGLFTAPVRHLVHVSGLFRPISEHGIMGGLGIRHTRRVNREGRKREGEAPGGEHLRMKSAIGKRGQSHSA
jgi:hypothetical protein